MGEGQWWAREAFPKWDSKKSLMGEHIYLYIK